jgi:hypothetical protein
LISTAPAVGVDGRISEKPEAENSGERKRSSDYYPLVKLI